MYESVPSVPSEFLNPSLPVSHADSETFATDPVAFTTNLLDGLGADALADLAREASERADAIREKQNAEDVAALEVLAKKLGATVTWAKTKTAAVRPRRVSKAKNPAPIKFRDPANPDNVWSGRGRSPIWLRGYTEQGRSPSEFMV